jgi:hypothetical protein
MPELLDTVPNGSDVLIDANVFVYGLTAKSAQCQAFLARCSREEFTGIALFESVNNATHQFMKGEALHKGLCTGQAMKYLSANPDEVKLLTDYWANTQRLLALNLKCPIPTVRTHHCDGGTARDGAALQATLLRFLYPQYLIRRHIL